MRDLTDLTNLRAVRLVAVILALFCAGLGSGSADAREAGLPGQTMALQQKLTTLSQTLQDNPAARHWPMTVLRDTIGLDVAAPARIVQKGQPPAASAAALSRQARAQIVNFRISLAILSQTYGGKDNLDILLAQPDGRTDAVSFRDGRVTLADIRRETARIAATGPNGAIRAPVLLWEDTVLQLGPEDVLALSRPDGAFLISFGRVVVTGSTLSVSGGENPTSPDFVPFVTVAGGGSLWMQGAQITGLGFGNTAKFSGLAIAANPLMRKTGPSRIEDSFFEDIATLSITGKSGVVLRGNRFHQTRNNALHLGAAPLAVIEANLFFGDARTNAIRLLNGSSQAQVTGNMILQGDRTGIVVEGRSDNALIRDNVIWRRDGGAIKFAGIQCGAAHNNLVLDSRQKGIEIRKSHNITVSDNLIAKSRNAGIWVSAQSKAALTRVSGNQLYANKSGLSMASGGQVMLAQNDFSTQMPRLLGGDVGSHSLAIIRDLKGQTPVMLDAAGFGTPDPAMPWPCLTGEGS